ncbi:MAG: hypothetical protein F3741_09635 [Nitrospinae bacterium]|nr:hypothetical protein [Nitrospinota bacterium]MZH41648.1 hypothetical protein [Nitrospinota bacterium]MZH45586.1 hypothetical protein [Nitrospinota bacterium]
MEFEQVQVYCEEAKNIAKSEGTHAGLSYLIGEKFGINLGLLKKARQKLQFLYPNNDMSEDHPLNQGGRSLKMSYALTIQEHYSGPLEQVKQQEALLNEFAKAILNTFRQDEIKSYLESSPNLSSEYDAQESEELDMGSEEIFSAEDLLMEAEEILILEDIKKMLIQDH